MSKTKYHPILFSTPMVHAILEGRKTQTRRVVKDKLLQNATPDDDIEFLLLTIIYKYKVGDVLWVRETFTQWPKGEFQYFVDTALGNELGKWKPSIHMPKEACRIFLKIKSIRVERLQDISEEDAIAEGIVFKNHSEAGIVYKNYLKENAFFFYPVKSFCSLWESINGDKSWDKNPFVWVYEFEQIEKPLDFLS